MLLLMVGCAVQMKSRKAGKISALIISPTRELASQIAVEAEALGRFHNINVQVSRDCTMAALVGFEASACTYRQMLSRLACCWCHVCIYDFPIGVICCESCASECQLAASCFIC